MTSRDSNRHLTKQKFQSQQIKILNHASKTLVKQSNYSNSYRRTSEIGSYSDKSSVDLEENFSLNDTEVSRSDSELGIEGNLKNLSLLTDERTRKLTTFKDIKLLKSVSYESIFIKNITKIEDFVSYQDLTKLIKQEEELRKIRHIQIYGNANELVVVLYVNSTVQENVKFTLSPTKELV